MIVDLFYMALFIGIGISLIKYRKIVKSWTGNFVWAEQYIGRGGTYFIILIIGFFLIFIGVIYPFGGLELILGEKNIGIVETATNELAK